MNTQKVVERILSDAEREAQAIVVEAEKKATELVEQANLRAEQNLKETQDEIAEKVQTVKDRRAAQARLECAKIQLAEKRRILDEIYASALNRLVCLEKADALALTEKLLERYAEEGDEVVFAETFPFVEEVCTLPVYERKKLVVSAKRLPHLGGMRLVGEKSDRDLSFGALLDADREQYQSALARALFKA